MNNNRNNNNRRRGRGNRPQGGGGNPVNRIDSRARGNAPQMLEKYKKLAQDAQHNGDRVQAEYYLQFADHYYRVLADTRTRQEENRPRQDDGRSRRGDERFEQRSQTDDFYGDEDDSGAGGDSAEQRSDNRLPEHRASAEPRRHDRGRDERDSGQDYSRDPSQARSDERGSRGRYAGEDRESAEADASQAENGEAGERPARRERMGRNGNPRGPRPVRAASQNESDGVPMIDAAVLPPAFKVEGTDADAEADTRPMPRRRRAKPAGQDDDAPVSAVG